MTLMERLVKWCQRPPILRVLPETWKHTFSAKPLLLIVLVALSGLMLTLSFVRRFDVISTHSRGVLVFVPGMFLFGVASLVQALRGKGKVYYLNALGQLLVGLAIISIYLNQLLPFIGFLASAFLVGFEGQAKRLMLAEQEYVRIIDDVDPTTPLRLEDIFTTDFWLVMASKWGVWRIVLLRCLLTLGIIGGVHLILYLSGVIDTFLAASNTLVLSIFFPAVQTREGNKLRFISMIEFLIYLVVGLMFSTIILYGYSSKVF